MEKSLAVFCVMNLNGRIQNSLNCRDLPDAVRELHLRRLLDKDESLGDVLKYFGYKLSMVQSNKNAIMTIMNDLLWELMSVMWDKDYLVSKWRLHSDETLMDAKESKSAKDLWKDKQLGESLSRIREMEAQLSQLEMFRERAAALMHTQVQADETWKLESEVFFVPSECVVIDAVNDGHEEALQSLSVSYESRIRELENEKDALQAIVEKAKLVEGSMWSSQSRAGSIGLDSTVFSEAETRGTSSQDSRIDNIQSQEQEVIKQREIANHERMDEFLAEIVEKDEIIQILSDELRAVSVGVKNARRSTAPISRRNAPIGIDVPGAVSKTGSVAFEEKRVELAEANTQNERLRMNLASLETENASLLSRVESLETQTVRNNRISSARNSGDKNDSISQRAPSSAGIDHVDSPAQTVENTVVLSTRKSALVEIQGCGNDSERDRELEAEREKTRQAIEETKTVKFCLNELERQLASLQFQLRQAGVKQEHIKSALAKSGLTNLMRASRAAVFERLYRDAMDRITRMEKIRKEVHEIQARQFIKKFASGMATSLFDGAVRDHPTTAPNRTHILGGGYLVDPLQQRGGRKDFS
jgi:hypothetical protein